MTNKLKCPFCGVELGKVPNCLMFCCRNKACRFSRECMEIQVWQALIDGKKAQDALLFISNIRGAGMSYQEMFLDAQAIAKYVSGRTASLVLVGRYTQDELNKITIQDE